MAPAIPGRRRRAREIAVANVNDGTSLPERAAYA